MRIIESICKELELYLLGKNVVEIACGEAKFSLESAKYAKRVTGIDIESVRLERVQTCPSNVELLQYDALELNLLNRSVDVVACMNGLGHMQSIFCGVLESAIEKVGKDGRIIFISSWKMDRFFVGDKVMPILETRKDIMVEEIKRKEYDIQILTVV